MAATPAKRSARIGASTIYSQFIHLLHSSDSDDQGEDSFAGEEEGRDRHGDWSSAGEKKRRRGVKRRKIGGEEGNRRRKRSMVSISSMKMKNPSPPLSQTDANVEFSCLISSTDSSMVDTFRQEKNSEIKTGHRWKGAENEDEVSDCSSCRQNKYCIGCIQRWVTNNIVWKACHSCRGICSCKVPDRIRRSSKASFRDLHKLHKIESNFRVLQLLLPYLKQLNHEQDAEKMIESNIQGLPSSELRIENSACQNDERAYCNHCKTSITDLYRTCPTCEFDLCITCCKEIRENNLSACTEEVLPLRNRGTDYMHGGYPLEDTISQNENGDELSGYCENFAKWKTDRDGAIPCPPKEVGGCGVSPLKLKCMLPQGWTSELETKSEALLRMFGFLEESINTVNKSCSCSYAKKSSRKASCREDSDDNYLYCPHSSFIDLIELKHFQRHWTRGEPVIVRGVLNNKLDVSWEPKSMWSHLCQSKIGPKSFQLETIDCLACCKDTWKDECMTISGQKC
ncbi:jumonji domain-containing protein 1C [Apostasia shenzhenica]|uniref:Jumonji domain-containing protein 1C n=1 Tax=Apostasia shenzhenica TaxID=1088818 RepID=A0A2I0B0L8_9ASPA|nr:jumonji domain-containing protein 1C [Apostasia shenzhenica]